MKPYLVGTFTGERRPISPDQVATISSLLKPSAYLFPVHNIPERLDVVSPCGRIPEVVGMSHKSSPRIGVSSAVSGLSSLGRL